MSWQFAATALEVMASPPPVRTGGYRKIIFSPPGYDGISGVIDDGRLPVEITVTILARTYETYQTLSALFESGTDGELRVPYNGDHWVYEDAFVPEAVNWARVGARYWKAQLTFVCPNPRPTWLSTGLAVY
jgi:hypothetical protein